MIELGWGIVIFAIVEIPMLMLILISIFGHPRMGGVTARFIAIIAGLFLMFIIVTFILANLLGLFIPIS